jgi:glutamine synthetase
LVRVRGGGQAVWIENHVPGSDVNPYLAAAAMIAAGLHGIEQRLELDGETTIATTQTLVHAIPRTLRDAADLFAASEAARAAFGDEMVTAGVQSAWSQLADHDRVVTDWERYRGFEQG